MRSPCEGRVNGVGDDRDRILEKGAIVIQIANPCLLVHFERAPKSPDDLETYRRPTISHTTHTTLLLTPAD